MFVRFLVCLALVLLSACASQHEKPLGLNWADSMRGLQKQSQWYLEGRLALADGKDSISAGITWRHDAGGDDIELTGPLAQGRLRIVVAKNSVVVDDGDHHQEFQGEPERILAEQLGVEMPVGALRYWVLGVVDPDQQFIAQPDGFVQAGWRVIFTETQAVGEVIMPRKISAVKDKARIKLVVDQWDLS